jgi:beta-lactamase regulating signal transducer with metallopeptidase domain/LysM repeat protein
MIEQLNAIAGLWWNWVAAMFWQVGLLIVLIACVDRLTRRWTWPQLRYALWSLVLIKLVLPPTLSLPSSVTPRLLPVVAETLSVDRGKGNPLAHVDPGDNGGETAWATGLPIMPLSTEDVTPRAVVYTPPSQPAIEPAGPALDWRVYALGLWLAGSVALAAFLILRLRSLSKAEECTSKTPSLPESFYNQVSGCAGRLGLRHRPRVVATNRVTCPAVFGVWHPVLLMPHGYLGRLSRRDTEHMLLHELAHVKRGDLLAHGFYMLLQIVYWYNPLLWLVRRQIHHLRELCCDATVAGLLREDTGAYRETLLETARRFLATRTEPGLGLLGLFEDSNRLLVRLNWLNKPTWRYRKMKRTIVIAIVGVMLVCVLPMAHSQPTTPSEDIETPTTQALREQFAEQMAQLRQQMQQLQEQRLQLQQQMQQMGLQMAQLEQQRAQFVQNATNEMFQTYTVRPGDTLTGIAKRFSGADESNLKETIDQIMEANQLTSADQMQVGQQLRIPLSVKKSAKIRKQLDKAQERVHDMSGTLAHAEHALNEAEHAVASVQADIPRVAVPEMSHDAVPGDLTPVQPLFPVRRKADVDADYIVKALKPGTELRITNSVGSIKIQGGPGRDCAIKVKVEAKAATPEEAEEIAKKVVVQLTPTDDRVDIGVQMPDDLSKEQRDSIHVDFDMTVPQDCVVRATQSVGDISLAGLGDSTVQAHTNVGTIRTRNLQGKVALMVNVGDIDVVMPADASATVRASAKVGAIKSDLPLDITSASVTRAGDAQSALGSSATGVLGAGAGKLDLTTNVGSIRIRSAAAAPDDKP